MAGNIIKFKFIFIFHLAFFNLFDISACKKPEPSESKIIIIGAGPSGIAAASKLLENGFKDVTILEAEDRIGGRVYTTQFGNYSVDLGGQWIHGEKGNVAFELAVPFDIIDKTDRTDLGLKEHHIDSLGNFLSKEASKNVTELFLMPVLDVDLGDDDACESVGEYAEKMFNKTFKDQPEMLKERNKYLDWAELVRLSSDSAESWFDVSTKEIKVFHECPGDLLINWKERGYSTILDILMKKYPNPENELPVLNNTVLNAEVTSINYSNNVPEAPSILINTTNGQLYKADHVLVTVSLGVLKEKHTSLFVPALPKSKVAAIENIAFGTVAKIYLFFDKPFWTIGEERILNFNFLWNKEDRKVIESDPERHWILGIEGAVTVEHKPNLLTMWVTGKYCKEMETISEEKVFKHSEETLRRFLDKVYNVTAPVAMLRTRWYSNPHFRGTYSYRSIETHKEKVYPEMLENPVIAEKLRLLFAGEATSGNRFSTVDGAIGSGWKAADRLINYYKSIPNY